MIYDFVTTTYDFVTMTYDLFIFRKNTAFFHFFITKMCPIRHNLIYFNI